jgi:peptidyl-prolyl cis-trans isomerase C
MFSLRKSVPSALFMIALSSIPALAQDAAAPAPAKAQPAKEQPAKEQTPAPAKEQAKEQAKAPAKEQVKTSPSDTMVRVNGTAITRLEIDRAVKVMLGQNQVQAPLEPEILKQAQEGAAEQLTSAELLYQEAAKFEVKDLDKQVAEKVAQNRAKFGSDADFETALKGVDMTLKDMNEFTRKDIVIGNFIEKQLAAKVTVSDADAQKFYDENQEKYFKKPETFRASHILIGTDEKTSAEDRKKAKEKAEALLKKVKAGEDFAALAKSDSSCPSSSHGGDLGNFSRGQMVAPFEKAALALKPGEIASEVVETQFGYHIIKLTEKQEATTEKFPEVKERIVEYLKREKTQKQVMDLVTELRKTAKIEKL